MFIDLLYTLDVYLKRVYISLWLGTVFSKCFPGDFGQVPVLVVKCWHSIIYLFCNWGGTDTSYYNYRSINFCCIYLETEALVIYAKISDFILHLPFYIYMAYTMVWKKWIYSIIIRKINEKYFQESVKI